MTEVEPRIQAEAPSDDALTYYDRQHFLTYARLIDADKEGADWKASAAKILQRDVENDLHAAELCYRSHLARARWIIGAGLNKILDDDSLD
jgi:hypothetical protein